eukprot:108437_1
MALKLNPTILKAGRLIGYGSIHSNLNCITLAVIKSINYEESSVQTVDIDEYNMDNCRVQSHSWNNLFIIAPVITIDLDDGTSELKQYALQGCVPTSSYEQSQMYFSLWPGNDTFSTVYYPSHYIRHQKEKITIRFLNETKSHTIPLTSIISFSHVPIMNMWDTLRETTDHSHCLAVISLLYHISRHAEIPIGKSFDVIDPFKGEQYDMDPLIEYNATKWNKKKTKATTEPVSDDGFSDERECKMPDKDDCVVFHPIQGTTVLKIIVDRDSPYVTLDFGLSRAVVHYKSHNQLQSIQLLLEKPKMFSYAFHTHFKWLGSYSAIIFGRFEENVIHNSCAEKGNGWRRFEIEGIIHGTPSVSTYIVRLKQIMEQRLAILVSASRCTNSKDVGKILVEAAGYKKKGGFYTMNEMELLINKSMIATVSFLKATTHLDVDKRMIRRSLMRFASKHDLTLFTNCQKKTIDGHVWNMMSTKPRHWSYNEKYHKAVQQWLVAANRLKTRKQCFDFLCITN